jgi:uncharacterized membrane protein YdjX (TVP38/TMEM64 family)
MKNGPQSQLEGAVADSLLLVAPACAICRGTTAVGNVMADMPNEPENRSKPALSRTLRFLPAAFIVTGIAVGYALGWHERLSLEALAGEIETMRQFAADNPVLAPMAFMLLYAVAIGLSFPAAAIFNVIGGLLFGWLAGTVYAVVAATSGGAAVFVAARSAFGDVLRKRAGGGTRRLARGFEEDAFSYLLMLRLAPFIPFFVVNIVPALFNVRLGTFLAATMLGKFPVAFAYAWLGQGLDSMFAAAMAAGRPVTLSDLVTPEITIALLALTLVVVLATIVRKVRAQQAH